MTQTTNPSGYYPAGYRVLVKPDPIDKMTKGGIYIPETSRDDHGRAQTLGTVVAIGPFAWDKYPRRWAQPGDRVLFAKYGGLHLKGKDGVSYRMLNDEQITAVVDPEVKLSDVNIHEVRQSYE